MTRGRIALRLPSAVVEELSSPATLVWLLAVDAVGFLAGVAFYVTTTAPYGVRLAAVPSVLYPLYADSPTALALAALSLATLLPRVGEPVADAPRNRPLAYLHTFAFVWLVKYGLWTVVGLGIEPGPYASGPDAVWAFWGVLLTHVGFVPLAAAIPHYGATTRRALAVALLALLTNDAVDYWLGYHPPLRYEPGALLAGATVALSVVSVWLAHRSFDRLGGDEPGPVGGARRSG